VNQALGTSHPYESLTSGGNLCRRTSPSFSSEDLLEFFEQLLQSDFMPHGHCYQWRPEILWLHVISDGLIAFAYAIIPFLLAYFVKRRKDLQFRWIFLLFGAFILCCGATHALEVYTAWVGAYRLTGIVKALTAVVSLATAFALVPLIPKALKLPSPAQLKEANQKLLAETRQRLEAETALANQEKDRLFKNVVEAAPNGILLVDREGTILMSNQASAKIFGYDNQEIESLNIADLVPPTHPGDHQSLVEQYFQTPSNKQMAHTRQVNGLHKEGRYPLLEISLSPLSWNGQKLALASIIDITEQERRAHLLQETQNRFNRAVAATADGLWEWTVGKSNVWFSPQFARILHRPEGGQTTDLQSWLDLVHPQDRQLLQQELESVKKSDNTFSVEHRLQTQDGSYQWYDGRGRRMLDRGEVVISGSLTSIQHRKIAELALEEKSKFLDSVINGVRHAIFVIDVSPSQTFSITQLNQAHEELSGMKLEDVKGKSIEDLFPEYFPREVATAIIAQYRSCVEKKAVHRYTEMIPFKGKTTWWLTNLTPVFDAQGRVHQIIGASSEISRLKQLEDEMRQREEHSRKIIDYSLNGLYIYDLTTQKNTFINPSYTKITGYSQEDFKAISDFSTLFHPEDLEKVNAHITRVLEDPNHLSDRIEYRFRHKDGHWIWCLSSDTVFSTDKENRPLEMIGTFIDITSIKESEEKLKTSNAELEQFAFVASHDLREPLRKVMSFGKLLESRFAKDLPEKAQDYIRRMTGASARMDTLIADLLSLSRITSRAKDFSPFPLQRAVDLALTDLSSRIKKSKATIETGNLPTLEGDENQFYQVMLNLIGNALKYSKPDTAPTISISAVEVDNSLMIKVRDNGIGFDPQHADQIFGIFKRLHNREAYEGSGIGLAICKKIIARHHGRIEATSTPGQGSTFTVILPNWMIARTT
jgi:PAS domain S-box-containing protein